MEGGGSDATGQQQHVAHMIYTEHGYLTSWNDKVPRVWVAWWEGDLREALTQAAKHLYQGVGINWILFVPRGTTAKGVGGIKVQHAGLGKYGVVLLTSSDQGIHGVPPPHFARIMQDQ